MSNRALGVALGMIVLACGAPAAEPGDAGTDGGAPTCTAAAECDDGAFCNGEEACRPGMAGSDARGCAPGTAPCIAGTTCDEASDACVTDCSAGADADGDGHDAMSCDGDDCDDTDARRFPGAIEVCDLDGHDEDCDETTPGFRDADGDGTSDARCCNGTTCGTDCDDGNARVRMGATEACDRIDNDCNGAVDEGALVDGFVDGDRDLHGDPDMPLRACAGTPGFAPVGDDCEDGDPAVHGAQPEICDGVDNDCDTDVDETPAATTWYADVDGDGFGSAASGTLVSCVPPTSGFAILGTDCDDARTGVSPAADEQCNGRDDDCNGVADFVIAAGDLEDDDLDGVADMHALCPAGADCDDRDPATRPGAPEVCDGRDNDCDGLSDDGTDATAWYPDADGDGWGDGDGTAVMQCEPPRGHVLRIGDCDDSSPARAPGLVDGCNMRDDDCDEDVDEDTARRAFYPDGDGDGFGASASPALACAMPSGLLETAGDCDDTSASIRPGGTEACNGDDDDCDGTTDEGFGTTSCGVGACMRSVGVCTGGMTVTCVPGAPAAEVCNGMDDDCNASTDEEPAASDACSDARTIGGCTAGACTVVSCVPGSADCNALPADGCEVDTRTSTAHCGSCGHACRVGDTCIGGLCQNEPIAIDAGESHTCVLLGSGAVYCWGLNARGQLGDGTTTLRSSATRVSTAGSLGIARTISTGLHTTCALDDAGTAHCWGSNDSRQIEATTTMTFTRPTSVVLAGAPTGMRDLEVAETHICAITSAGTVLCWGSNADNRLGGSCGVSSCPPGSAVLAPSVGAAAELAVGGYHSHVRRIAPSIDTVSWGRNAEGQLGVNSTGAASTGAQARLAGGGGVVTDATAIAGGRYHGCLIRPDRTVWCAGQDTWGAIGDDAALFARVQSFAQVVGITDAVSLGLGTDHTCAIRTGGALSCWGRNQEGQLLVATAMPQQPTPVVVTGLPAAPLAVTGGLAHTCAILASRRIVCWGDNSSGQLGGGDTVPHPGVAVVVTGLP